ncbi:hypothetical protein OCB15_17925 [Bacillus cereus]|nr:hypothetical protein [Bacillus cereus]MEC3013853.1 hypothetical protein [Bacillus cereus]
MDDLMAIVPMKQTVTRYRQVGDLDIWGKPEKIEETALKCRAVEGSHAITDRSSQMHGATIVVDLKLMFDKLADIQYDDKLEYVNESGTAYKGSPRNITVQRDFSGKPLITVVYV